MGSNWANFFPYFAGALKLIVLGIGGYFAVKWHFDEEKRVREKEGAIFEKPSLTRKVSTIVALTILLTSLVWGVVYLTNWVLYT